VERLFNFKTVSLKLPAIKPIAIKATYFRFIGLQYLQSPLSAIGSMVFGGRYNYKNSFETLYLAPNSEAAIKESTRGFSMKILPKVLMSIEVTLCNVIDLGDQSVLNELKINIDELFVPWRKVQNINSEEAFTQKLGRAIFACGHFEAIRYPSAMIKNHYNLAVFPERLSKKSTIKIYDPEKIIEHTLQGKLS
jgi:RES domain-containing protein